jgi:hypothetical protein
MSVSRQAAAYFSIAAMISGEADPPRAALNLTRGVRPVLGGQNRIEGMPLKKFPEGIIIVSESSLKFMSSHKMPPT